jgi:hypothetical protein
MSAYVLISGTLHREPVMRTGKESGRTFWTALVRCETGDVTLWCNVIAFDEAAQAELMRLKAGDAFTFRVARNPTGIGCKVTRTCTFPRTGLLARSRFQALAIHVAAIGY